jgi:electron transfer flavoprotein alpha subunit
MSNDICVFVEHIRGQINDISYVLCAAARELAAATGGQVIGLLVGHNVRGLATDLGVDLVRVVDDPALAEYLPDVHRHMVADLVAAASPRATLLGDTSMGAEIAGSLSVQLGVPLVSYCRRLRAENGTLKYESQLCGGKIVVEGDLPGPSALVAMIPGGFKAEAGRRDQPPPIETVPCPPLTAGRIVLKGYIEPDTGDIDIAKEAILVSVGRGIQNQDNLSLADDLATALGGVVSASRPVVDQGWLPTSRLVGKSGKRVKPKLYLALGISGATEHVEAITDSETIIAINADPAAPIFGVAKYGATLDLFDLVPALTEKLRQAKQ